MSVRKIYVKLVASWDHFKIEDFYRFCKQDNSWGDLILTNQTTADFYVILNHPCNGCNQYFDPAFSIVMQNEPLAFRKKWGKWRSPDPREFYSVQDIGRTPNWHDWRIDKSYSWLTEHTIHKTKGVSAVVSDKNWLPGHRKRLNFLKELEKHISIDIFGIRYRKPSPLDKLQQYLGEIVSKEEGLFPYRYTFAAENACERNYFTEKITDAILSECLCFYWGCPNITDFLDPRAYVLIDPNRPARAVAIIMEAIRNDLWKERISYIRIAKQKILNELQIMPTIERIILSRGKSQLVI